MPGELFASSAIWGTGGADEFRVGAGVAAYSPSAFGRLGEQDPGAVSEGEVAGCRRDDAGELAHDGELLVAIQRAFSQWTALLARQLQETGVPAHRVGLIATATLAAMEGALAHSPAALLLRRGSGALEVLGRLITFHPLTFDEEDRQ